MQKSDAHPSHYAMKAPHLWMPFEILILDGQQVNADLYMPVNTSDLNVKIGQSAVDSEVPGAPGLQVAFQEKVSPVLYHDLSTDRNMSWVRSDSWLTYLSLDAPDSAVTYDMGISPTGVIRLAPFGTPPMAVVGGQRSRELPRWVPGLPLGTPQVLLWVVILLGGGAMLFLIARGRAYYRARGGTRL